MEKGLPHKVMVCTLALWAHFIRKHASLVDDQASEALIKAVSLLDLDVKPFFGLIGLAGEQYDVLQPLFQSYLALIETEGVKPVLTHFQS